MPIYLDTPKTLTITQGVEKGVTNLVRGMGIAKRAKLIDFVVDLESVEACSVFLRCWNEDFSELSAIATVFAAGQRKLLKYRSWVFCGDHDYFYVHVGVKSWAGNPTLTWTIHQSFVTQPTDSLAINDGGNVLYSKPAYETGVVIDRIDSIPIRDSQYELYQKEMEDLVLQTHSIREKESGVYPRAFVDGEFRVFNDLGDSMIIASFDWNTVGDTDTVLVQYVALGNKIRCTTGLGLAEIVYAGAGYYTFSIVSGPDEQTVKVWVDLEKSLGAGSIYIDDISTVVVKKYLAGSLSSVVGFNEVVRDPTIFSHYRTDSRSDYSEVVSFVWNGGTSRWEASLSKTAVVDKTLSLLKGGGIAIPDTLWDYDTGDLIWMLNADYDSSLVYELVYRLDQTMIYEIDLTPFSSIVEFYLLPLIDIFSTRNSAVDGHSFTENVPISANGRGKLRYFSNEVVNDVVIERIQGATSRLIPTTGIVLLSEDNIGIDPAYYSDDSTYMVTYMGMIANSGKDAEKKVYWRYRKVAGSVWSSWVEWNGRDLVPWKYHDGTSVQDIDKVQIKVEVYAQNDIVFLRGAGLVVLSTYAGELAWT